jgi:large subunit ribosomal protein L15
MMPIKYTKRSRHFRASRHNGWGIVSGGHRKKGQRDGFGKTGLDKGKWIYTVKYLPGYFGKHGFKRPVKVMEEINTINLKSLEQKLPDLEKKSLVEKKGTHIEIDLEKLGYNKLLSMGKVNGKYNIKVKYASKNAIQKVQDAGGSVMVAESHDE